MLKKKRLKKFLNRRCEKILNAVSVFCLTGDPEKMHQLRVEVKKINALAHLLDICSGGPSRQILLKPLEKVYHKAALIRDAQVKLQLLSDGQIRNEVFEKEQREIIAVETKRFCAHADRHQHRVEKVLEELTESITGMESSCVLAAYRKWLNELAAFFSGGFAPDDLHENRKKIKDLMYIHAFLPESIKAELHLNRPYIDELQNTIGQWRDSILTTEILSVQALANESIIARLQEQSHKLLETVKSLSADFISKAKTESVEPGL